jgi:hypothetical protein
VAERHNHWRLIFLLLFALGIVCSAMVGASPSPTSASVPTPPSPTPSTNAPTLQPYVVHLAQANTVVFADAPGATLADKARSYRHDATAQALADPLSAHQAGPATYDGSPEPFKGSLTDAARSHLAEQRLVASVDPAPTTLGNATASQPPRVSQQSTTATGVSSVDYGQLYSPYMWGKTSYGGLSVQLTLLDSTGTITIGVPIQTYDQSPTNYIKVDPAYLYYETVFEDPHTPTHPAVMIVPGDQFHVVTSGTNPNTGQNQVDDKMIIVDNLTAWTSFRTDTVYGTAPPNSNHVVTVTQGVLSLSNYLSPGAQVTYANVMSTANGPVTLKPGTTGFVRLQHANGDEIYTYHGQTLRILENSPMSVAWFNGSAQTLNQNFLVSGVVVTRPVAQNVFTLQNLQGQTKASIGPKDVFVQPYDITFTATILGGDTVIAMVNGVETFTLPTTAITAVADIVASQVTGSGPANTLLTVGAGLVDGYLTHYSSFSYVTQTFTSSANGSFASGTINCGSIGHPSLQPGSFGWVGYEDSHGNCIYSDFAAPRNDVMSGFPYVEGWVANGLVQPSITVTDSASGSSQVTAAPIYIYLDGECLRFNLFYFAPMQQFINPADTVSIVSGSTTYTIVVDQLPSFPNVDANTVVGQTAPGASVMVIPSFNRQSSVQVTANQSGSFTAVNPYVSYNTGNCSTSTWTNTISQGSSGRTYLTHSDGSRVFVNWGRSMHIDEIGNDVESYLYPTQNLDWFPTPSIHGVTATVTLVPTTGPSIIVNCPYSGVQPLGPINYAYSDDTVTLLTDSLGNQVPIRAGARITATFLEGIGTVWRPASISVSPIPFVLLSPDLSSSTVGGLGAASWSAQATLTSPPSPSANPILIGARNTTAVGPFQFINSQTNEPITLIQSYSGRISSSDLYGHRVWSAWAATADPIKITSFLQPGNTVVCATATPNNRVTIYDVTNNPSKVSHGSGPTDASSNFCITVNAPLVLNQVVIAEDSYGTDSEAIVVKNLNFVFLPCVQR